MNSQDKMYLVSKIFNNETIRTVWDKKRNLKVARLGSRATKNTRN